MEIIFDAVTYVEQDKILLDDVNCTLHDKKIYGVVSSNLNDGYTFTKLLALEVIPNLGEIHYDRNVVKHYSPMKQVARITKKIGYVKDRCDDSFSHPTVFAELENRIRFFHYREAELEKRVYDALQMVGLKKSIAERSPQMLSMGEKKKLSLALALVHNPALVILENPTLGLDYYEQDQLLKLLRRLKIRYHKTIVILTEEVDFMNKIIDDVILIDQDKHVICDKKFEILKDTRKLKKMGIEVPNTIAFSDLVLKKKQIKMGYRDQINDLIKDIYRYAEWGRDHHESK